jgi:hypothetical protein
MNDEQKSEGRSVGLSALLDARLWCLVWCAFGAYILIAAYGSSALKLAAGAFLTGFMVARNLADLVSPPNAQ